MKIDIQNMKTGSWKNAIAYFDLYLVGNNDNKMVFKGCSLSEKDGKTYINFPSEFKDGKRYGVAWVEGPMMKSCKDAALTEYEKQMASTVRQVMDTDDDIPF